MEKEIWLDRFEFHDDKFAMERNAINARIEISARKGCCAPGLLDQFDGRDDPFDPSAEFHLDPVIAGTGRFANQMA